MLNPLKGIYSGQCTGSACLLSLCVSYNLYEFTTDSPHPSKACLSKSWCLYINQGILKEEVSLDRWRPVWLVWNQLYDNRQFLFLFSKQTIPNQSDRSTERWYFPLYYSLIFTISYRQSNICTLGDIIFHYFLSPVPMVGKEPSTLGSWVDLSFPWLQPWNQVEGPSRVRQ